MFRWLKPFLLTTLTLLLVGCGGRASTDSRLSGTFVSDKAASVAFLKSTGQYDAERLKSFANALGQMEVMYKGNTRTTVLGGEVTKHTFTVVDSGPDHITIECQWTKVEKALMGEDSQICRIEFTDDGYWLGNSKIPMDRFKEKFVKKETTALD